MQPTERAQFISFIDRTIESSPHKSKFTFREGDVYGIGKFVTEELIKSVASHYLRSYDVCTISCHQEGGRGNTYNIEDLRRIANQPAITALKISRIKRPENRAPNPVTEVSQTTFKLFRDMGLTNTNIYTPPAPSVPTPPKKTIDIDLLVANILHTINLSSTSSITLTSGEKFYDDVLTFEELTECKEYFNKKFRNTYSVSATLSADGIIMGQETSLKGLHTSFGFFHGGTVTGTVMLDNRPLDMNKNNIKLTISKIKQMD